MLVDDPDCSDVEQQTILTKSNRFYPKVEKKMQARSPFSDSYSTGTHGGKEIKETNSYRVTWGTKCPDSIVPMAGNDRPRGHRREQVFSPNLQRPPPVPARAARSALDASCSTSTSSDAAARRASTRTWSEVDKNDEIDNFLSLLCRRLPLPEFNAMCPQLDWIGETAYGSPEPEPEPEPELCNERRRMHCMHRPSTWIPMYRDKIGEFHLLIQRPGLFFICLKSWHHTIVIYRELA